MGDSDIGIVSYGERQGSMFLGVDPSMARNYSEDTAKKIDEFVRTTVAEQYKRAKEFLLKHRTKLDELAKVLLDKETMSVDEFLVIFEGEKNVAKGKEIEEKKAEEAAQESEVKEESDENHEEKEM